MPAQRRPRQDHVVHVYGDSSELAARVADFLAPALAGTGTAVVVATPVHRALIAERLVAQGLAVDVLRESDRYVERDAEDALASFSVEGCIDGAAFLDRIGGLVGAAAGKGPARVYGEMVARLWGRDDADAALELEHLWNDLALRLPFELFCAYPATTLHSVGTPAQRAEMLHTHTAASTA